jgi:hypothetical protein
VLLDSHKVLEAISDLREKCSKEMVRINDPDYKLDRKWPRVHFTGAIDACHGFENTVQRLVEKADKWPPEQAQKTKPVPVRPECFGEDRYWGACTGCEVEQECCEALWG